MNRQRKKHRKNKNRTKLSITNTTYSPSAFYHTCALPKENNRTFRDHFVFDAGRTGGGDSNSSVTWSGASTVTTTKGAAHSTLLQREAERSRSGTSPRILPSTTPAAVAVGGRGGGGGAGETIQNSSEAAVMSRVSHQPGISPADVNGTAAAGRANGDGDPVRSVRIAGVSGCAVAGASAVSKEEAAAPSSGKAEELRSPRPVEGVAATGAATEVGS